MRFGICNEMFEGWTIEDVFRHAAEAGYQGVEVAPFTLASSVRDVSPAQRTRIRDAAARAGVAIIGLHWLLVSPKDLYVTHPDAAVRKRTQEYFIDLVNFAADLGADRMIFGSPKQRNVMDGVTFEQAWAWARDLLRGIASVAERRGVTICIEPLAPSETNFINTALDAIRLAKEVDSPRVKIILDAKAMSSEATPIPDIIRRSGSWVAHVHANDPNLRGPGFGELDFRPIASALRDIGYRGWVSVEVFDFTIDPNETAAKSIAYLREAFRANEPTQTRR